jgi:hypothetical protein
VSSESKAERARRHRAAKLGDLMPDTTSDENDEGWSEKDESDTRDDELRRDVPPHHG